EMCIRDSVDALRRRVHPADMSIIAIVENDSIKLPPGVHVPDGTKAEIVLQTEPAAAPVPGWLQRGAGTATSGMSTDEIMRMTRGGD
ncbi:MAG: hypothetical protein ABMA13_13745, partial [Chthoniobacteraceae bacterium]